MTKQRPDPDKLANELAGASGFFSRSTPRPDPQPIQPAPANATSRRHDPTTPAFDLNRETATHDTLRLSADESRAIDELKSALRWEHDLTVSKNDVCRAALHDLIERYRQEGAASPAVRRLRAKRGRGGTTS